MSFVFRACVGFHLVCRDGTWERLVPKPQEDCLVSPDAFYVDTVRVLSGLSKGGLGKAGHERERRGVCVQWGGEGGGRGEEVAGGVGGEGRGCAERVLYKGASWI